MSLATQFADAGVDWLLPDWPAPRRVAAFATTRNGSTREGERTTLDLGPAHLDSLDRQAADAIREHRLRVAMFLPSAPVWLEQVHATRVLSVDAHALERWREQPPQADAAVTRLTDTPLAVRVADCLPVLFADAHGGVVGIAHAGWRGLAAGVLETTLHAMQVPPASVIAWIGPGIGPKAFEVGSDVRDAFCCADPASAAHLVALREGKWLADLPSLAVRRLRRAGVEHIHGASACTYSDPQRFFSYRRDRSAGRQGAFVWLASRS